MNATCRYCDLPLVWSKGLGVYAAESFAQALCSVAPNSTHSAIEQCFNCGDWVPVDDLFDVVTCAQCDRELGAR